MRTVTTETLAAIGAMEKTGDQRAHSRVVIYKGGRSAESREMPNVKSVTINRTVDIDVATCTIEFFNSENIPMAVGSQLPSDFGTERMGWYTPTRGDSGSYSQEKNAWYAWIVPDHLITTFDGYGINRAVTPENDVNMYQSGVWWIDDVSIRPDGVIRVECRDAGRELIESVVFPPAVPRYPIYYLAEWFHPDTHTPAYWVPPSQGPLVHGYWTWCIYHHARIYNKYGEQIMGNDWDISTGMNTPELVWAAGGKDGGSLPNNGYWKTMYLGGQDNFAVGNGTTPNQPYGVTVAGVHVITDAKEVYISLRDVSGTWHGDTTIPRKSPNSGYERTIHENLTHPVFRVDPNGDTMLPYKVDGVERVKVIASGWKKYPRDDDQKDHSAKLYDVRVTDICYYSTIPGYWTVESWDYGWDYVDIVRELAWRAEGLLQGHVIESGTGPVQDLGVEIWDQKPLIDGIRYVKDILGYIFWVDEQGKYNFRPPNIYVPGNLSENWTPRPVTDRTVTHTQDCVTLPDSVLHSLELRMSSRNRRDHIFVANVDGEYGATVAGYSPYGAVTRRVAGWTDQNFASQAECQRMAELIGLRQASKYRAASVTIPGDPRIQIDDQVIVKERVTGSDYRFYVSGMTSTYESLTGVWTYELTLEWLGTETTWLYDPTALNLSANTTSYINAIISRDYV